MEGVMKSWGGHGPPCPSSRASLDLNVKLVKDDGYSKKVDPIHYQSMVSSLLYAKRATHPDIANAVGTVSKFNAVPTQAHLIVVKKIF